MMQTFRSVVGIIPGLVLGLLVSTTVSADWIYLENGSKIQGEVVKKENNQFHIRIPNGTLTIRASRVKRIEKQEDAEYQLDQAKKNREYGNFEQSIEKIRAVLKKNPDSRRARTDLKETYLEAGRTWFQDKKVIRARKLIKQALQEYPGAQKLHALLQEIKAYERDVRGTLSEAKNRFRNGQYRTAIDRYEEVAERLPEITEKISTNLSGAYLKVGKRDYRAGNLDRAIDHFEQSVQYDPERMREAKPYWLRAVLKRTNQLMEQEQFSDALGLLNAQIENFPGNKRLKFLRAYSFHLQGKLERAIGAYGEILNRNVTEDAPDISALQKEAAKASDMKLQPPENSRYQEVLSGDWRTEKTKHFTIYHRNEKLGKRAKKMVEQYFQTIRKTVQLPNLDWDTRCEVYVYPDRETYNQNGDLPGWSAGETQVDRTGGVLQAHRILTYQTTPQLFQSVLPHEVAHVMFYRIMNYRRTPLWLKEGVAVFFEFPAKKKHYLLRVQSMQSGGDLLSLEQMLKKQSYPEKKIEKEQFYAQSYSLVQFLLQRGGWPTLIEFGKMFSRTAPEDALEEVYGFSSLQAFRSAWIRQIEAY